jgi:uncharacterized membrane protein YfcA
MVGSDGRDHHLASRASRAPAVVPRSRVTPLEGGAIMAAGAAAAAVNAIVGSGSLITFPTLLAFGYSPVVANVTNTVGLIPGSAAGTFGYRRELRGQERRGVRLGIVAIAGGITGGLLLLVLPATSFERVVPFLILLAAVLVAVQPRLAAIMAKRRATGATHEPAVWASVFLTAVYGGYFGAAQGVIMIALLGVFIAEDLQRLNGLKNLLGGLDNAVAGLLFIFIAPVAWDAVLLLAIGAVFGGTLGARVGRRLPPNALRAVIVVVGTVVGLRLLLG